MSLGNSEYFPSHLYDHSKWTLLKIKQGFLRFSLKYETLSNIDIPRTQRKKNTNNRIVFLLILQLLCVKKYILELSEIRTTHNYISKYSN